MKFIWNYILDRFLNRKGQGIVEYIFLAGFIALAVIAVLLLIGPALSQWFQRIVDSI